MSRIYLAKAQEAAEEMCPGMTMAVNGEHIRFTLRDGRYHDFLVKMDHVGSIEDFKRAVLAPVIEALRADA
jgi:hypothetical protein